MTPAELRAAIDEMRVRVGRVVDEATGALFVLDALAELLSTTEQSADPPPPARAR